MRRCKVEINMGNGFAYLMLAIWPMLAIYMYSTKSIQKATLWTLLGGFLILPVKTEVDIPLIPPLGKHSIPVLSALIGCWVVKRKPIGFFYNKGGLRVLVWMIFISPFITVMFNKEPVSAGYRLLPGLTNHDAISFVVNQLLFIAPFFLGRRFFKGREEQILLFKALVLAGLIYSLLMLFEIKMSPQLHSWVYGYFPHEFGQQIRFGGFRPVVFIGHGLEVAFFISIALIASVTLWINKIKVNRLNAKLTAAYIGIVLFLCKSVAAFLYGLFSFISLLLMSNKRILNVAFITASIAFFYPVLSIMDLFPHDEIINIAESFDKDRAGSLEFRFKNEERLLKYAEIKSFFGWGGWGRNRVYDDAGKDISVTDGLWIIQFGQYGWAGFLTMFGLMYLTVLKAKKSLSFQPDKDRKNFLAAHTLIVSIIMIDQLPNASLVPWYWLIIGALFGQSEDIMQKR